jgi:sarcosine oxidase subunit beta
VRRATSASGFLAARVVIIGGGVIGMSIAFHLAGRCDSVIVLESGTVGGGSTARATGGVRQQFPAVANMILSREAVAYFARFAELTGEEIAFRQHGYLFVTADERLLRDHAGAVAQQRCLGIPARTVSPVEIGSLHPQVRTDDLAGGTYCATDGSAMPSDVTAAFARAARRRGVEIRQHARALAIRLGGQGQVRAVAVHGGSVPADVVVDAAGPWAAEVLAGTGVVLPIEVRPRQAFAVAPLPWLHGRLPMTVDLDTGAYLHPEPSGAGVIGGADEHRAPGMLATVDDDLAGQLVSAVTKRLPAMAEARVVSGWAGLRARTPDDVGLLGPAAEVAGLWLAAGFGGHGFMQAPVIGRELAGWLVGGRAGLDVSALRPDRFAGRRAEEPGAALSGRSRPGPPAARARTLQDEG